MTDKDPEFCAHEPSESLLRTISPSDYVLFHGMNLLTAVMEQHADDPRIRAMPLDFRRALSKLARAAATVFETRETCFGCVDAALRQKDPELYQSVCDALGILVIVQKTGETEEECRARGDASLREENRKRASDGTEAGVAFLDQLADEDGASRQRVEAILRQFTGTKH